MSDTDAFEVQITYPDEDSAQDAASLLVGSALAACGQITEIRSVFAWEGAVSEETEWLLTLKTIRPCLPAIEFQVSDSHPYDVPQVTALPIAWASAEYLAWINESCSPPE